MKRILPLILVCMLISTQAFATTCDLIQTEESRYQSAISLVESGRYDMAAVLLAELGDYQDAPLYALLCQAFLLIDAGVYDEAAINFEVLESFGFLEDSSYALYAQARQKESEGAYEEAIELYIASRARDSVARVAELKKAGIPDTEPVADTAIAFQDEEVERIVRKALGMFEGKPITAEDMLRVKAFRYDAVNDENASGEIRDISDLALCKNLEVLEITTQPIDSVEALRELDKLREVSLHACTSITDLSPLANKPALESLWINGVRISDISFLENSPNLTFFNASWGTNIRDISVLAGFDKLTSFYLDQPLTDFSPLESHPDLQYVKVCGPDADALGRLVNAWSDVEHLTIMDSPITNDSLLLLGKYVLKSLTLENCPNINDISTLSKQTALDDLRLLYTGVSDITPLAAITRLSYCLDLRGSPVADISPLSALTMLTSIYLSESDAYTEADVRAIVPADCYVYIGNY